MSGFLPPSLRQLAQEVFELLVARKETVSVLETVRFDLIFIMLIGSMTIYQATGGLISASLLSFPGSSAIYKGGITVNILSSTHPTSSMFHCHLPNAVQRLTKKKGYSLESRVAFAGWTQADIDNYTGPTTEIVGQLASYVCHTLKSTYGLSESGTAGPTGGPTSARTP
jgi:nicotinamide mononucleotide (NMN) deamidase PncC